MEFLDRGIFMCGRMNISDHEGLIQLLQDIGIRLNTDSNDDAWQANYNVAPSELVPVLLPNSEGADQTFDYRLMRWGLTPAWLNKSKNKSVRPLINARSEIIWQKPSFRHLIKTQRAIILANGFYEWQRVANHKTAYYIWPADARGFMFAAIYQQDDQGNDQCCVITTHANQTMAKIHDRMPVILNAEDIELWFNEQNQACLNPLMQACADQLITTKQVSSYVNNARNKGPACLQSIQTDNGKLF